MLTVLKTAFPTMVQKLLSFGTWYIFFMLIEHMGERPIAITIIVRSVYMLILKHADQPFDRGTTPTGDHEYPASDHETFHVERPPRSAYMLRVPVLRAIHLLQ